MKQKKTNLWMFAALFAASAPVASAQYLETFGVPSGSPSVATYEGTNGFDQDGLTYSAAGTGTDIRTTNASVTGVNGYPTASGGGNALIQPGGEVLQWNVVNTTGCTTSSTISFGVFKTLNASNGSELKLQYLNAGVWTDISWGTLPTGSGTSHWYLRTANLPAGAIGLTQTFRFINTKAGSASDNPQFRIDDISFSCGTIFDCSQVATPVLTLTGDSTFCEGGSALITSTTIVDASYTFYQLINGTPTVIQGPGTDNDIVVDASGTYYVVQTFNGCVKESNRIWIYEYAIADIAISTSPASPVAPSSNVTATANIANSTLFFSEYVEGSELNKYLEIYNPTGQNIVLDGYQVRAYHNGSPFGSISFKIPLTGTLNAGDVYVIAHEDATVWPNTPDLSTEDLQFNGNDALVLIDTVNNDIVDIFGSVGPTAPSTAWGGDFGGVFKNTVNRTFLRKPCIYRGVDLNPALSGSLAFRTLTLEWDTVAVDTTDNIVNLGSHNFGVDFVWGITNGNGAFAGGDNTGSSVDVTVGQQGTTDLEVELTGLCTINDCGLENNSTSIIIAGARNMMVAAAEGNKAVNMNTYPNPFSTTVNIAVEVAQEGNVKIEVIDMYGKVVGTVANTNVAAGNHNFVFDGSNLNNGTYTARVISGNTVETVRLVKTK